MKRKTQPAATGFRYVGRYCHAPVESTTTYATKAEAAKALKAWKKSGKDAGYHIIGRVVPA